MKTLTLNETNITMEFIAKTAGVSLATVSRVFSDSPKVSAKTKELVIAVAEKYNFHPNEAARTLVARKSKLIAVILPDLQNPYFAELLSHLETLCGRDGYSMIFYNSNGDSEKEKKIVRDMISRQADGMLITLTKTHSENLSLLKEAPFPVVVMTRTFSGIDSVGIRHTEGGMLAAEYLLRKKVNQYIYFGLEDDEKFFGFRELLLENGVDSSLIKVIGNQDWYFNTIDSGAMILSSFVKNKLENKKTGLYCVNDLYAAYALRAAHECGIKVPEQLSIVGFDDTLICKYCFPQLTSIQQPIEEIANYSFRLLMARINNLKIESDGEDEDSEGYENIVLTPRIMERGT